MRPCSAVRASGRRVAWAAVLVLAMGAVSACAADGAGPGVDGPVVTMVIPDAPLGNAPPLLMDALRIDREHGFDADLQVVGSSSTTSLAALLSGDADFAVAARVSALDAAAKNPALLIVGATTGRNGTLVLRNDVIDRLALPEQASDRQKVEALRGLTIATGAAGGATNLDFRRALTGYGLNPDTDVRIVPVTDASALVGGIGQGQFDGAYYSVGVTEANIARGEAKLYLSLARGQLSEVIAPGIGGVIMTKRTTLERNPDLVSSLFDALVATEQRIATDPVGTGAMLKERYLPALAQPVFDLAWNEIRLTVPKDGRFTQEHFRNGLQDASSDIASLRYDQVVYDRARG
jgi:NitT/TauT family transport system substrate-binding protein